MLLATLSFLLGVVACQHLPELPSVIWSLFCCSTLCLSLWLRKHPCLLYICLFLLGFSWAGWRADCLLAQRFPAHLQQQDLHIQGTIVSLPETLERGVRFEFLVQHAHFQQQTVPFRGRIRLTWYPTNRQQAVPDFRPTQQWQYVVRLKRPHRSLNPGGFDAEAWLFQKRLLALGYVRQKPAPQLLREASPWHIDALRFAVQQAQQQHFAQHPHYGLLGALSIGAQANLSDAHWYVFRATGTLHLLSISGLHVGMIGVLAFVLIRFFYRYGLPSRSLLFVPATYPALVAAFLAATLYALLAGFSIPTQRTLLMLSVLFGSRLLNRHIPLTQGFALAMWAVLLFDPLAVLSAGFWLSFGAVFILLLAFSGQTPPSPTWHQQLEYFRQTPAWSSFTELTWYMLKRLNTWLFSAQLVVFIGLVPLLLKGFGQLPLTSIPTNAVAIPLVSLLIVPLILLGSALLLLLPTAGIFLLNSALWLIDGLMAWLSWCLSLPIAIWEQAIPPLWTIVLAGIGAALLLLPKHFPARWVGVCWFLPALLYTPARPAQGEFRFTLLDVDQGLAAVVQTQQHTLLYDTGTDFFGKTVVVPYLRSQGVRQLDALLISHTDADHIGGAQNVLQALSVAQLISNAPKFFTQPQQAKLTACLRGKQWQWDGVLFELLHPAPDSDVQKRNNGSCVLKISTAQRSVLLTGDIEKRAEVELVMGLGEKLSADVLVVPHHGSQTSSLALFIKAVHPHYALLPVGYLNRYRLPHPNIVQRYQQQGIELLSSVKAGAIRFDVGKQTLSEPQTARERYQRYWRD